MIGKKKIAILGVEGFRFNSDTLQIISIQWKDLDRIINIRDYHLLILCSPTQDLDGELFYKKFDLETAQKLLGSGASVIFLGDPRNNISIPGLGEIEFLSWTGLQFEWDPEPGDTVEISRSYDHERQASFLSDLRSWQYSLASVGPGNWDQLLERESYEEIIVDEDIYCENRYGHALAFKATPAIKREYPGYGRTKVDPLPGSFIFLPRTARTLDEDVQRVLSDLCNVEAELPEPEWLAGYNAPGQDAVDREISRLELEALALKEQIEAKKREREATRIPLRLLYDRGESLEGAVCEVLAALGAEVRRPDEPGKEDGWIRAVVGSETLEIVLEVKSTKKDQFGIDGLRQLLEWIQRGIERDQIKYKGLFIGNSGIDKEPRDRRNPFSKDWIKTAELNGLVAMRTEDLYQLYILDAENKLDRDSFWLKLFGTAGVFDLSDFVGSTSTMAALTQATPCESNSLLA